MILFFYNLLLNNAVVAPPPAAVVLNPPTVIAPPADTAGKLLDARIAAMSALVNKNANLSADLLTFYADTTYYTADGGTVLVQVILPQYVAQLNTLQVEAIDHYMVTGWVNAAAILAVYSAPSWDKTGQALTARVASLQALYNKALITPMPLGNANGYGSSGWTTLAASYLQTLYAAQIALVERIMDVPGGTTAATMLSTLTGVQTAPGGITYEYAFTGVGFTDAWIDD